MNRQEIEDKLSTIAKLEREPHSRAFLARIRMRNAFQFFRPLKDDVVLFTSVRNATEPEAIALGSSVLDFVTERFDELNDRDVTKLAPFSASPPWVDSVICFSPAVSQTFVSKGGEFLTPITYDAYPINSIEFAGDETDAEATIRKRHMGINDITRKILPIVFARYQFADGIRSAKHFAVGGFDEVADLIRNLARVGGSLEVENFERIRCLVKATPASGAMLTTSIGEDTGVLPLESVIALFAELTTKGVSEARKALA